MDENRLYIVGSGSGGPEHLTPEAAGTIDRSSFVAGGRRLLGLAPKGAETYAIGADLDEAVRVISGRLATGDVCVLTSGDPGCFSILPVLNRQFHRQISVIPGISSVQLLAARLGVPWQEWRFESFHGRGKALRIMPPATPMVYFCDEDNPPSSLAGLLLEQMEDCPAIAGSNLGTEDEQIVHGTLRDVAESTLAGNSLLQVPAEAGAGNREPLGGATAPGIPDGLWARAEGIPMSKSEVRSVLLGKAQPAGRAVIWDVGSGTGAYSVECALLEPHARVLAIDRNAAAGELLMKNAVRFGAIVESVAGEAPDCLEDLPAPDLVIIGGNNGRLDEIFAAVKDAINPGGRIVVTAVLERTKKAAHQLFAHSGLENRAATRVSIARGKKTKWEEHNPVIIFTGDRSTDG